VRTNVCSRIIILQNRMVFFRNFHLLHTQACTHYTKVNLHVVNS
jgi:hypothetical protein